MARFIGIVSGAYQTLVKRSDGKTVTLAAFVEDNEETTITGVYQGAYGAMVRNSAGELKPLADHIRANGGATVAGLVSGAYGGAAKQDDPAIIVNTGQKVVDDEAEAQA